MELRYPVYYQTFSCIAGNCPDSCCHEWEVDVDPGTAEYYRQLPGDLGDRLREVLVPGEDGWASMALTGDRRCPMWRKDGLCRIQAELGHDALCGTCRAFPRIRHDHGDFMELGLELSCPEAARIILSHPHARWITETVPGGEEPEYDGQSMVLMRFSRDRAVELAVDGSVPVGECMAAVLLYACQVQYAADWKEIEEFHREQELEAYRARLVPGSMDAVYALYRDLEILTDRWRTLLERGPVEVPWRPEHRALLRYFIDRYWLQAAYDGELVTRVLFILVSCLMIRSLGGDPVEMAQLYSKEIENDADNVDALQDALLMASEDDTVKLLQLLLT